MIRFWTKLQYPDNRAALIEDGKIIDSIPDHSPKTPARWVSCVGDYEDQLVIVRTGNIEFWKKDGSELLNQFLCKQLYAVHAVAQWKDKLAVCSSGLDLFFLVDYDGNIIWEWWAKDAGVGGFNPAYESEDWFQKQVSGREFKVTDGGHYNSLWVTENGQWLTSALKLKKVLSINPMHPGVDLIHQCDEHGVHSPIFENGILIHGLEQGIMVGENHVLQDLKWVKHIRKTEQGFVCTHEEGVTFVDPDWKVMLEFSLPRPFGLAALEMT
ncbi:MAG: hypothetical protein KJ560_22145 [Gammaproteobacteria bacterium]|uniref:Uncharacterized protein n=1 Tax=viral metagenome TaxID=1070528 RepID=A0A6M3IYE1_9ZZZZ|nr:hypothetical protein [Gammaproteobacteria bacterium]